MNIPKTKKTTAKTEKKRLILLDAHAILHRAYHALPDFAAPNGEPTGALYGVVAMLLKIVEELKPDYIVACYDLPEPTYRHDAFADYKGKREKTDEALVKQIIRSRDIFAVFNIPIYEKAGFEADDLLGTIAFQTKSEKDLEVVIASGDMDTMQCVDGKRVKVYTLKKGINDTILYDETAVKNRFGFPPKLIPDYKGLRGDPSDNIPGIAGVGEKTATDLIIKFGSLEKILKKINSLKEEDLKEEGIKPRIFKLLQSGEEEAIFSKMLATIRTDVPVEFSLPKTTWRESLEEEKIFSLFSELGFRTLLTRLKNFFEIDSGLSISEISSGLKKEEWEELALMLWLLESDRTNPSVDDIVDFSRARFLTDKPEEIKDKYLEQIRETGNLYQVFLEIEKPLVQVIQEMKKNGIKLDVKYLGELSQTMHQELGVLEKEIWQLADEEFNINSPKQLGEILFDKLKLKPKNQKKTDGGQKSTKESELEKMLEMHEIIPKILRYRELQKLVSTYIDALPTQISADGRLRTEFLQTGTTTGRMASKNPNLQNIPTRTEESRAIRKAFVAEKDYTLVSIDYSQIELRIAALLSKDEHLLEIFKNDEDVHTGVAMRVFGVTEKEVTSEMRRKAKVINFGILYGMGVNALRTNLGKETKREEAQEFLNAYFNTFTRLAEYLEETKLLARGKGFTETLFGRRRYFPGINSSIPFIRAQAERMVINAPVQGTAADVVRIAMNKIYDFLEKENKLEEVRILLQVHDELIFEIKDNLVAEYLPKIKKIMEEILPEESRIIPLKVSVSQGENWAELK